MSYPTSLYYVQKAMYTAMTGDTTLMARITGVYDNVTPTTAMPYIRIGLNTEIPAHTFGSQGREATVTLHIWTPIATSLTAYDILADLMRLFDQKPLTLAVGSNILMEHEFTESLPDPDGLARQTVVRFRTRTLE